MKAWWMDGLGVGRDGMGWDGMACSCILGEAVRYILGNKRDVV